jgi:hypothetical protein
MANACLFIGWNRAIQGREQMAMELFQTAMGYYGKLQASGTIESVEPVLLATHGGDMNGFIMLRGDQQKLAALRVTAEFMDIETQASLCLQNVGVIQGFVGEGVQSMMQLWNKHLPKYAR